MQHYFIPMLALSLTGGGTCNPDSTFSENAEGWTGEMIVGDMGVDHPPSTMMPWTPTWQENDGNPDGFISFTEVGDETEVFFAPSAFLGDLSDRYGGRLVFDLLADPPGTHVAAWLVGNNDTLASADRTVSTSWDSFSLSLSELDWVRRTDRTALSRSEMQLFLAEIDAIYIRADWAGGDNSSSGLDNVGLCAPTIGDLNGDGCVSLNDLLLILAAWGPCDCAQDLDGDNDVNIADLLLLFSLWDSGCPR